MSLMPFHSFISRIAPGRLLLFRRGILKVQVYPASFYCTNQCFKPMLPCKLRCLQQNSTLLECKSLVPLYTIQCCLFSKDVEKKDSNEADNEKDKKADEKEEEEEKKLNLFQRYKKMAKEYWYVLIPVHAVTSVIWFGSFYFIAQNEIDIVPLLEAIGLSETIISPFRNSSVGFLGIALALYKLATPARYAVTLGGTTFAIKELTKRGLIKPMPSRKEIKKIIQDKVQERRDKS